MLQLRKKMLKISTPRVIVISRRWESFIGFANHGYLSTTGSISSILCNNQGSPAYCEGNNNNLC